MSEISKIWDTYRGSWDNADVASRNENLSSILTEDFEYRDPAVALQGQQQLSEYMQQFQEQYPGASFATVSIESHHDRGLIHWNMVTPDQEVIGNGISFAQFENGKLKQATGFFKEE